MACSSVIVSLNMWNRAPYYTRSEQPSLCVLEPEEIVLYSMSCISSYSNLHGYSFSTIFCCLISRIIKHIMYLQATPTFSMLLYNCCSTH